jgi:hypothetical protein
MHPGAASSLDGSTTALAARRRQPLLVFPEAIPASSPKKKWFHLFWARRGLDYRVEPDRCWSA